MPRHLVALAVFGLVACGGGSDSPSYQQLADQASQLEAQARSFGVNTPCANSTQCGLLTFFEAGSCPESSYQIYSTVSNTAAAASAAASQEVTVAEQANAVYPGPFGPCPSIIVAPPVPVCLANSCVGSP
jgi:hypothetical protein